MKKILCSICFICLLVISLVMSVGATTTSADSGPAHFEIDSLVERNALRAGVVHEKYVAYISNTQTGFSAAGSGGGGENVSGQLYPQSVNFLSIPRGSNAKIVNWAMSGAYYSSWKKGTVESMALDFEANNPGWKVIAGINADFFDISGHQPMMQAPSGASVVNGEVYKATTSAPVVGFTNQSSGATLVGNQPIEFSREYYLNFYDNEGTLQASVATNSINPVAPNSDLSLYFSYYYFPDGMTYEDNIREYVQCAFPSGGYLVTGANLKQEVCYSAQSYYGAGYYEQVNSSDVMIKPGSFGFYTTNETILSYMNSYPYVSVSRKIINAYGGCDNITGCGNTLVYNGEGVVTNNKERHPRTIVGVKEDGTIVLCTVDGRQPNKEMYGMTLDELSATLLAYGCVEGYNLDGGGSTTMIIRDGKKFRTLNSPSDGSARLDANALLVVVQDIDLGIEKVTDTTCKLTSPSSIPGTQIENIVVHVNDQNYQLKDSVTIEGLNSHQIYTITYEYDRIYHGITTHMSGEPFEIRTGYRIPKINDFKVTIDKTAQTATATFNLEDPDNVVESIRFYYTKGNKVVDGNQITINLGDFKEEDYVLVVFYNLDSTTKYSDILEFSNPEIISVEAQPSKKGCFNKGAVVLPLLISFALIVICIKRKY